MLSRTHPASTRFDPGLLASADDDRTHWLAAASVVAAVALGGALQVANGLLNPYALGCLTLALVVLCAAVVVRRRCELAALDDRIVPLLGGIGLVLQIAQLYTAAPGGAVRITPNFTAAFSCGVAGLGLIGSALISRRSPRRSRLLLTAFIAIHFAMGMLVIRHSPATFIDVDVFQRDSVAALLKGINPYAITFPNIYHDDAFYGTGMSVGGRLQFGFPYFPLSLLLVIPGEVLAGDHRYAALVAMELTAWLMASGRARGFGALAAVLYLTTPRGFFVLEQSWTEPFVVLGLAALVAAACRRSRVVPWLFGAFIALKQYLVFALPAALLLVRPGDRRSLAALFGKGALIGAAITVPFVLWNPAAFIHSVVTLQFHQPFRHEALSYLSWWASNGHPQPSAAIAFIVAGVVATIAVWRLPHTAAGFTGTVAATFLAFFAFNKQAFCNYYFFVVGALCSAVAAAVRVPAVAADEAVEADSRRMTAWWPAANGERLALAAVVVACLIPLVWPGDVSFINDEPLLIAAADHANAARQLAQTGLLGTFGFIYGPLPTWVYQALLLISTDLVVVAVLHTILIAGATAIALWWLSRSLGLWAWFAPLPLLSPYFWFYSRVLWDNPFLIPLGALALAGYAAHLSSSSKAGLPVAVAAMLGIPLVHLMGAAFVLPLALHMVVFRWRALWAQRASITTIVAAVGLTAWPYWHYLVTSHTPAPGEAAGLNGFVFPLLGGRLLSARELRYFYGAGPVHGAVFNIAAAVTWLSYVLVWAGLVVAAIAVVTAARNRDWTPRTQIATVAMAMLGCQIVLDGFTGKFEHPQYYNGTWIVFALFAWLAVDWAARQRTWVRFVAPAASGVLATTLLLVVVTLALRLHMHSGTRDVYGPTLANQQRIARELSEYSPRSQVTATAFPYTLYPHALETLRQLNANRYETGSYGEFEIRYASGDPASGAIELVAR